LQSIHPLNVRSRYTLRGCYARMQVVNRP
jgi:hypothetical protein